MRFLILSSGGDGLGLGIRLRAEGHRVRIWMRELSAETAGTGLVDRAEGFEHGEIVIADCTGNGAILDSMRDAGIKVFGGSGLHDRLEMDRQFAEDVMKQAGILVPESKSFTDWEAAEKYIQESEHRLAFKPEGNLSGNVPSYCPKDNQELLESLEHFKSLVGDEKPKFTLQQFIEGTAVSTEGWFNGERFIEPFNHTIERKHLMAGDRGPSGGCTGNLVWTAAGNDPIVRQTVLRLEGFLREHRYIGPIDVNAIVNEEGAWALELTPRMGYDAFPTYLQTMYAGDFGWLVYQMVHDEGTQEVSDRFGAGVRLTIPPWPTEGKKANKGISLIGIDPADSISCFYPYEVELRDGKLISSGGLGNLGVISYAGDICGEAFTRCYEKIAELEIVDLQYRMDLGEAIRADYRKLEQSAGLRDDMGWRGVDLDKTLAKGSPKDIGEIIPKMASRIRRWTNAGKEVRILTARANDVAERMKTYEWLKENLGFPLEVTSQKDHEMIELWDDRSVSVEPNTGERTDV